MRRPIRKSDVGKRAGKLWDALGQGAPDLLDDTDFKHPYPSANKQIGQKKNQSEKTDVQRPLVTYLRKHLPLGSVVFATTNHARSKQQIFALMRDGMLPGVPDICVCVDGARLIVPQSQAFVCFIECKHPDGGRLSDNQIHVQAEIKALRVPVLEECRSVEQAVAWLHQQGVPVR